MSKGARRPQPVPLTITFHNDSPLLPGVVWSNIPRTGSQFGRALLTVGDIMTAASSIRIENHPDQRYQAFVVETATTETPPLLPPSTLLPADGNIFLTLRMVPRQPSRPQPTNQDVKGSKRGGRRRRKTKRKPKKRHRRKTRKRRKRRVKRRRRRNH